VFRFSFCPRSSLCTVTLAVLAATASAFGCGASESEADEPAASRSAAADSNPMPSRSAGVSSSNAAAGSPAAASTAPEMPATAVQGVLPASQSPGSSAAAARPAAAPSATFAACLDTGGAYSDCDTLYFTMTQASPARCVQLTVDDCGGYGARSGLSADLPTSWRLASGSIGSSSAPCELGVFYPANALIRDASGSITWDESARQPTQIELKLTLEPASSAGTPESIAIATSEPLNPGRCED
jgi:hypothetical protein